MFFQGLLKYHPRRHFGEHFSRFLQIFEDFGIPLGLPFGTIFLQKVGSETESTKKLIFRGHGGGKGYPRGGMIRN